MESLIKINPEKFKTQFENNAIRNGTPIDKGAILTSDYVEKNKIIKIIKK